MIRTALLAALLALPALTSAQAIKCRDPASGKTLYTDQPCKGGELVVPARTPDEVRRDAEAAAEARDQADRREQRALERERQQLQATQTAQSRSRAERSPADSEGCRNARAEASFRAASFSASPEEIRTARYNAALACGQQPPSDVVVVQPDYPVGRPRPPYGFDDPRRPHGGWTSGGGFGMPVQNTPSRPRPDPRDEAVPVLVKPPSASQR